jgi:hypothetical protein
MVVQLIIFIVMAILGARSYARSTRGVEALKRAIKDFNIERGKIEFPDRLLLERGFIVVNAPVEQQVLRVASVKWIGLKNNVESREVSYSDVCSTPPVVVKTGTSINAVLPGLRVVKGRYSGVLIYCIDTRVPGVSAWAHALYGEGSVDAELLIGRGLVKTNIEWHRATPQGVYPAEPVSERVRVDVCTVFAKKRACFKYIELAKPGVYRDSEKYPEATVLLLMHKSGRGVDELLKYITRDLPRVFVAHNPSLEIVVSRGFRRARFKGVSM